MRLIVGKRVFAPRAWAMLVAAAAVAAFAALGTWQLGRAHEKQAMIAAFGQGGRSSLRLGGAAVAGLPRYQHVTVDGRFDSDHQVLLDNMPSSTGQPGYRVLTPLRRDDSARLLLIDRGWVPLGPTRHVLPAVAVAATPRTVAGRLDVLPVPGVRLGAASAPGATGWPRVLNFPLVADLEAVLGQPVEPRIVLLDGAQPDGFERQWRPSVGFPPERHLGYALQWFALAVAVLVAFVAVNLQGTTEVRP
ncbi:MAG TPA: SURF1 family protein [Steroidobacteraceae bacterium]|nr:SURF1 family protein [Steroidobacteraceae bacterium]